MYDPKRVGLWCRGASRWRTPFARLLVVAAIAAPSSAHPLTLTELLLMPLESLLQLQVTPHHAALLESVDAVAAPVTRAKRVVP